MDADTGRDETPEERADRNWADILQELRAAQTGTQILTGFLLAVAFQPAFGELAPLQHAFYLCLLVLTGCATLIGLAPLVMHRRAFRRRRKAQLVSIGNAFLLAMLAIVSVIVAGVLGFVFDVVLGGLAGLVVLLLALAAAAAPWILAPRHRRH